MGLRATVIKKYEVEYGNANGFNYNPETLDNIISEFCDDYYCGDDGYGGCSTDAYWEIDRNQFCEMVDQLADMPEEEFSQRMEEDWFCAHFTEDKPYSKKYVLDVFIGWLAETPVDSNYVRIGWL
jgi:hypothetical protein